jgi:hypothetical protein
VHGSHQWWQKIILRVAKFLKYFERVAIPKSLRTPELSNKSYYYILIFRRSYDTLSPQKRGTFLRCIFKDEQNENKLSGNFYILVQFHFKFLFKQVFLIRRQVFWKIRNLQALFGIKIKLGFVFEEA